ncbi:hypothetical protein GCM10023175_63150 [Pseudonocardia xishanensis]|uniref:Transposase DDE domain-containing protein n=1 Tax=Pseudonocardia xishanensis TaxID=630995 RepID=A0ABP8S1T6_9PSEU
MVLLAVDLLAWTQHLLLDGEFAKAEPKTLRHRLLHLAARITRGQRRTWVRIQQSWPWARELAAAFARLHACPFPPADTRPPVTTSSTEHPAQQQAGRPRTP